MAGLVLRLILAAVLVVAAISKVAGGRRGQDALATFGIDSERGRAVASGALVAVELALAAGVAAGLDAFAWSAAIFMLGLAGMLVSAIASGRGGEPCGCFGSRSTVGWAPVARNVGLAAGFAAVPFLPAKEPTTEGWLAIGLGVALLACAALAVAVLALAREIGVLRLRVGPGSALEIPEEGPELGSRSPLVERFAVGPDERHAIAVFTSEGCRVCQGMGPAIELLRSDPAIAIEVFDESDHADAWAALDVPGSPYAVALSPEGIVLAKGTFNNLAQLESVIAAAERRADQRLSIEGLVP
jgi:hypothetical protein